MKLKIVKTKNCFIFDQLKIEEALLRSKNENFCIINYGSKKAVVAGASSRYNKKIDIPIIKRFSGGGIVVVDEDTIFVTFIFSKTTFDFSFPEKIFEWSEDIYKDVFEMSGFCLKERDYTIGDYKFGGNAQYIKKNRWLHHSSFLWDFKKENMDYLDIPKIAPKYRNNRNHSDFLCKLKYYFQNKEEFVKKVTDSLEKKFSIENISLEACLEEIKEPHIKTTSII